MGLIGRRMIQALFVKAFQRLPNMWGRNRFVLTPLSFIEYVNSYGQTENNIEIHVKLTCASCHTCVELKSEFPPSLLHVSTLSNGLMMPRFNEFHHGSSKKVCDSGKSWNDDRKSGFCRVTISMNIAITVMIIIIISSSTTTTKKEVPPYKLCREKGFFDHALAIKWADVRSHVCVRVHERVLTKD